MPRGLSDETLSQIKANFQSYLQAPLPFTSRRGNEPSGINKEAFMPKQPPHPLQRLMDNPWLLLVLGILVPFVSYTLWGWVDLATVPPATLP